MLIHNFAMARIKLVVTELICVSSGLVGISEVLIITLSLSIAIPDFREGIMPAIACKSIKVPSCDASISSLANRLRILD
jgi:hypothetical protein